MFVLKALGIARLLERRTFDRHLPFKRLQSVPGPRGLLHSILLLDPLLRQADRAASGASHFFCVLHFVR